MGEYKKKHPNQQSRAIANSELRSKQLKKVDGHYQSMMHVSLSKAIQCQGEKESMVYMPTNNKVITIQRVRTETAITPVNTNSKIKIKGVDYDICTYGSVTVPANKKPKMGTGTLGNADWKDILMDNGNTNSATRLHVVNKDWGGKGENDGGNIHPGSQSLNQHHKTQEGKFKTLLKDSSKEHLAVKYECWFKDMKSDIKVGDIVSDPTVKTCITENGTPGPKETVTPGDGMKCK